MQVDLQPTDPLSQVVFVHDYLQLVFQDCAFTLYNVAVYSKGAVELRQDQAGFCDALVALIDQAARADVLTDKLLLHFSGGAIVAVSTSGPDTRGPEAWQFARSGRPQIVEQNA
jgi:hypothetical protein